MGVPFEALLPYGIMIGMFAVTGVGLTTMQFYDNDWKRPRYNTDVWDRQSIIMHYCQTLTSSDANHFKVMERDRRLTGSMRGQTDKVKAPPGFELNKPWKLEKRIV